MLSPEHGVVGILAGAGSLPREVAQHVTARGGRVHVVTLGDTFDDGLAVQRVLAAIGYGR